MSTHEPPYAQGDDAHSSMFVEHINPVNPAEHVQTSPLSLLLQVLLFWHGADAHGSVCVSHCEPV